MMERNDIVSSDVMFSLDTETAFKDVVFINAALVLGENIVHDTIELDSLYIHQTTLNQVYRTVLKCRLSKKELKMIFTDSTLIIYSAKYTENIETNNNEYSTFAYLIKISWC
jgi:pyruvate,water dikinase